jgi:hypothetical protein
MASDLAGVHTGNRENHARQMDVYNGNDLHNVLQIDLCKIWQQHLLYNWYRHGYKQKI